MSKLNLRLSTFPITLFSNMSVPLIPHIPDDLQKGIRIVVETKYGSVKGGKTTNGAAVFLGEVFNRYFTLSAR